MLSKLKMKILSTSTLGVLATAALFTFMPPTNLTAGSTNISSWSRSERTTNIQAHAHFVKAAKVTIDGSERSTILTEVRHAITPGAAQNEVVRKWMKQVSIRVNSDREPVMVSCDIAPDARASAFAQPCKGLDVTSNTLVESNAIHTQRILVDSQNNVPENDTVLINVSYL